MKPVLYLSHYFKRQRREYYEFLQATRDQGALEEWLKFFLRGVSEVSNEATQTVRRIVAMREEHRSLINKSFGQGAASATLVLERLFESPIVSVADVRKWTGLTFPAANTLVNKLCEQGILVEFTGRRRNRRYRYAAYISIFADD